LAASSLGSFESYSRRKTWLAQNVWFVEAADTHDDGCQLIDVADQHMTMCRRLSVRDIDRLAQV
jgi:hypothetical protein